MAIIKPFKGIRPAVELVKMVPSRSVDHYSPDEIKAKLETNEYSFLHVITPDFNDEYKTKGGSPERLLKIKGKFEDFLRKKIFVREESPVYYIYRQEKDSNVYCGIIACCGIDDYFKGVIKIHEETITERENKLKDYLEICDFNAEPVLFFYPNDAILEQKISEVQKRKPVYDFISNDNVHHQLWIVNNPDELDLIYGQFKKMPAIYIADGHHRSASSALLGKSKREKNKNNTGEESYNFYLGAFFQESQLKIYDFNRVVKDLNGLTNEQFLKKLEEKFDIESRGAIVYKPSRLHNFSMYLDNHWYSLTAKKEIIKNNNPVDTLDAAILTAHILTPVLDIHDLKTDKRVAFVSGIKGMSELKVLVDGGSMKVAFGLYPVSMEQVKDIADNNCIMPPKTTWVEPKMRNGLIMYSLSD